MLTDLRRNRNWSETIIVLADLDDDDNVSYRLQPVLLDEAGNPALLRGDEAQAVIERLAAMSLNAELQYH